MQYLIYSSLMILALGLLTSPTLLSLSHILIFIPMIYFISKTNFKNMSKSFWALMMLSIILALSVIFNQDIATKGLNPILKVKYFLVGFLSIVPVSWWIKNYYTPKKISYLLYAFLISTTFATIAGIVAMKMEYNYISMRAVTDTRNAGLFGMLMNYAHNLSYFLIITIGLTLYRDEVKKFINLKFLYAVLIINLIGLYMTYTRGALLALVIGIPFYFFKKNKKIFLSAVLVFAILGGAAYYLAGVNLIRPQSDKERYSQWQAAYKAFEERPVLGYGYLNFETHSNEIKKKYNISELQFGGHAHNNFLEILATSGIVGLIAFASWLGLWIFEMYRRDDLVGNLVVPFIVTFIISGMTQSTITLGINLFFIMGVFTLSQVNVNTLKKS